MKEIRKLVSELKVGDYVKSYGVVARIDFSGAALQHVWTEAGCRSGRSSDRWPADAEVTVLIKEKRWRMIATHETTDPEIVENWQHLAGTGPQGTDAPSTVTFGPIEEVDA